jgi:hypothetical protein
MASTSRAAPSGPGAAGDVCSCCCGDDDDTAGGDGDDADDADGDDADDDDDEEIPAEIRRPSNMSRSMRCRGDPGTWWSAELRRLRAAAASDVRVLGDCDSRRCNVWLESILRTKPSRYYRSASLPSSVYRERTLSNDKLVICLCVAHGERGC